MKGHIQARGRSSWRLKFDAGRDGNGKRNIQYVTFRGTKREAQNKLAALITGVDKGEYVEPNKLTIGKFVADRIDIWEAIGTTSKRGISARTAQRYHQLLENQIVPHLGGKLPQKLKPADIETWHVTLRTSKRKRGGKIIAPRTIGHAHKVLAKALDDAVRDELVAKNVAHKMSPKVATTTGDDVLDDQMVIVQDVPALVAKLEGSRLRVRALLGLFLGLRIGETLAVRLNRIKGGVLQVREALEETKKHGIRFKVPKSKAGRRDISMPDLVIEALRQHRRELQELRLKLGLGRLSDDALLFANEDGSPLSPSAVSKAWGDFADRIGFPDVTYHSLRHTHVSQLIDAGVDIVTISKRLGHSKPDVTLRIYAHLFKKDDSRAAAAINAALS